MALVLELVHALTPIPVFGTFQAGAAKDFATGSGTITVSSVLSCGAMRPSLSSVTTTIVWISRRSSRTLGRFVAACCVTAGFKVQSVGVTPPRMTVVHSGRLRELALDGEVVDVNTTTTVDVSVGVLIEVLVSRVCGVEDAEGAGGGAVDALLDVTCEVLDIAIADDMESAVIDISPGVTWGPIPGPQMSIVCVGFPAKSRWVTVAVGLQVVVTGPRALTDVKLPEITPVQELMRPFAAVDRKTPAGSKRDVLIPP